MRTEVTDLELVEAGGIAEANFLLRVKTRKLRKRTGASNVIGGTIKSHRSDLRCSTVIEVCFDSRTWTGLP